MLFGRRALNSAKLKPTEVYIHLDGTFVVRPHLSEEIQIFLQHLNSPHRSIQFTVEAEDNNESKEREDEEGEYRAGKGRWYRSEVDNDDGDEADAVRF